MNRRRALIASSVADYSLPSWFQETTYIANSNSTSGTIPNLRLNLDYLPSSNTELHLRMQRLGNSDGFPWYSAQTIDGITYSYALNLYNQYTYPRYADVRGNYAVAANINAGVDYDVIFNPAKNRGRLSVKAVSASIWGHNNTAASQTDFRMTSATMSLFATATGGNPSRMRLYSNVEIYENVRLVIWLATGYNKNNTSEVGVYDRVRRRFILPDGTGTMYKGSDVT